MIPKKRKRISKETPKRYRLKPVSAAKSKVRRRYKQVCDEIDEEMIMEYGHIVCTSCETPASVIPGHAHSHNLPKGLYPEFETNKRNISTRCLRCHTALDDHDFEKIKEFQDLSVIMLYRKIYCPGAYNKFVIGLEEVGCNDYDCVEFIK